MRKLAYSVHAFFRNKPYSIDGQGRPQNPMGRTGISGRGLLGKWGPNHAADPIVSRFTKDNKLQYVAIKRADNGLWSLPGGMRDNGEQDACITAIREFLEEFRSMPDDDDHEEASEPKKKN
uniref:Nudix hydrolase domain-containing protein n=1 Tax=Ditylenchus dipsaci TaxID=166011 RepID=A0A915D508_9BILA